MHVLGAVTHTVNAEVGEGCSDVEVGTSARGPRRPSDIDASLTWCQGSIAMKSYHDFHNS